MDTVNAGEYKDLAFEALRLHRGPGGAVSNVLFDQLYRRCRTIRRSRCKSTTRKSHPAATQLALPQRRHVLVALQGIFEAEFQEGILVQGESRRRLFRADREDAPRPQSPPRPAVPLHRGLHHRPRPRARHQCHHQTVVNCRIAGSKNCKITVWQPEESPGFLAAVCILPSCPGGRPPTSTGRGKKPGGEKGGARAHGVSKTCMNPRMPLNLPAGTKSGLAAMAVISEVRVLSA